MPPDIVIFAQLAVIAVLVLVFQQLFRLYAITYRLTDASVQVMLLRRIPVSRTKYSLIREVRTISLGESFLYPFAVHWENKLIPRSPVVIYRKYWLPIIVSPDDPEEFAHEVRRRVYSAELQRSR